MKTKFIFLCALTLLMSVWACGGDTPQTEEKPPVTKDTTTETETLPIKEKVVANDLTTLEGFWATFQKAVAAQDVEKLKGLFAVDTKVHKFSDPEEQAQIAAGKASAITEDIAEPEFHVFTIVFSAEEDRKETGDDSLEDSETTIYMKKNNTGDFKIFNVSMGS